jgi:hypothetical protein
MTDRELLEAAAKAAGANDVYWCDEYRRMQIGMPHKAGTNYEEWNPLTDDGDALRLVETLRLTVAHEPNRGGWSAGCVVGGEFKWLAHGDNYKRAIVRAGAAMVAAPAELVLPNVRDNRETTR